MKTTGVLVLAVALTVAARRHVAWDGMVLGLGGSKIRGEVEMVAGKVAGTTVLTR